MHPPGQCGGQAYEPRAARNHDYPGQRLLAELLRLRLQTAQPRDEDIRIATAIRMMRTDELSAAPVRLVHAPALPVSCTRQNEGYFASTGELFPSTQTRNSGPGQGALACARDRGCSTANLCQATGSSREQQRRSDGAIEGHSERLSHTHRPVNREHGIGDSAA